MKKISLFINCLSVFLLAVQFLSCSKSSDDTNNATVLPTITTNAAINVTTTGATLGGTITSLGNVAIISKGICLSQNVNPTITDIKIYTLGGGLGSYSFNTTTVTLVPNTQYHVRAYIEIAGSIIYGNDVVFTTQTIVTNTTALAPTHILTTSAKLMGHTDLAPGITISEQGFCLKTSPGPTVSDIKIPANLTPDFDFGYSNLQPNTVYYERTYIFYNGQYHYSAETNFKTTGYTGASGGIVFYDKGQASNGWRYLEIGPVQLNYDITSGPGAKWGCLGTMIGLTTLDLGTGLENTDRIVSTCNDPNCAARLCKNYTVNGISGWFLPSVNEIQMMFNSLVPINHPWNGCWSSSELNATAAFRVYNSGPPPISNTIQLSKDISYTVWPIRRF